MADDGGVWVKAQQGLSTTGSGIFTKVADPAGDKWVEIGANESGGLSWGDFETNGDETTSNTWGPDGEGRMWKWAEWDAANDYSVNLTGGLYWVLACGGGDAGVNTNSGYNQGSAGKVREGLWEFAANASTSIKVGDAGKRNWDDYGDWSGIGNRISGFTTQGVSAFGAQELGAGGLSIGDVLGFKSFITGDERMYATGGTSGLNRPGQGGWANDASTARPGCVIIATAAPNAKPLNWVHTTYHAEVNDGVVTAVHSQKHYADGKTTPLPASELIDATYGVSEGWLFVDGELQPPPPPPEPTLQERIDALKAQIKDLQKDK